MKKKWGEKIGFEQSECMDCMSVVSGSHRQACTVSPRPLSDPDFRGRKGMSLHATRDVVFSMISSQKEVKPISKPIHSHHSPMEQEVVIESIGCLDQHEFIGVQAGRTGRKKKKCTRPVSENMFLYWVSCRKLFAQNSLLLLLLFAQNSQTNKTESDLLQYILCLSYTFHSLLIRNCFNSHL